MVKADRYNTPSAEDIQMTKAARAMYMRQWRARNRDRVRAINAAYWFRRAIKEAKAGRLEE